MGWGQKSFKLVWRYHQLLSELTTCPEYYVSHVCQQMISVIMKWYRGCAQISWHLPYNWRKPQKISARRRSMKAVRPVIASNEISYVEITSVGLHNTSGNDEKLWKKVFLLQNYYRIDYAECSVYKLNLYKIKLYTYKNLNL